MIEGAQILKLLFQGRVVSHVAAGCSVFGRPGDV